MSSSDDLNGRMFDPEAIARAKQERAEWEGRELKEFLARQPERKS
jgi:hypothetical protein